MSPDVGKALPDTLLGRPVSGVNLAPGTLREQLGPGPTLLVFLRQLGCMFCRETLTDMRMRADQDPHFPRALFFFQGSPIEGKALLRRDWPDLRAVSDPEAWFYEAFGIGRGGLLQMFGPGVLSSMPRARAKGSRNGARQGDVWRMPGVHLLLGSRLVWSHGYRHAADHPDYDEISERARASLVG